MLAILLTTVCKSCIFNGWKQTVNLLAYAYVGSNPTAPIEFSGCFASCLRMRHLVHARFSASRTRRLCP